MDPNGTGNGSGWGLNGRSISQEEKRYRNEFGTVVVQITVNRNGNVIAAKYTKGTTNTILPQNQHWQQPGDGNPMPMFLRRKLALLPLISN
jgi:hypothetical protein